MKLQPFRAQDITPTYLGWLNDKVRMRYSRQSLVEHTRESALAYLASFLDTAHHFWGLWVEDRMVGTATGYYDARTDVLDVGFLVGEPGRGYGTRACQLVLEATSARRITGGTVAANAAMVRIFERCGFDYEGRLRQHERLHGHLYDVVLYGYLIGS